jgi:hypothetical protein
MSIVVTLIYADNTQWIAGGFPTMDAANAWVAAEQAKPYWISPTQVQIVDTSQGN